MNKLKVVKVKSDSIVTITKWTHDIEHGVYIIEYIPKEITN